MQEKLSAMMDGEWDDQDIDRLLAAIDEDESCGSCWREFHLISDALNQRPPMSDGFMARFQEQFAAEPTVIAPRALRHRRHSVGRRWVAISMAASVVLVGATAFYVNRNAAVTTPVIESQIAVNQVPMRPIESDVNPYLVAHQDVIGNPGLTHRAVILTEAEAEQPKAH